MEVNVKIELRDLVVVTNNTKWGCDITNDRVDDCQLAVMLLSVPPLPGDSGKLLHPNAKPVLVAIANDYGEYWEWDKSEGVKKNAIALALLDHGAEIGKWYWCTTYLYNEPNKEEP